MDVPSILNKLTEDRSDQESVFVLFDGALFPAMQKAYEYEESPQVCPIYYGTRHEEAIDVSPCLYAPGSESEVWGLSEAWRCNGIVFTSQATFSDVIKHLQSLISVTLPSGQMAYWRFYSPEWLASIMELFEPNDLKAFSGPVTQWAAFLRGEWLVYQGGHTNDVVQEKEDGWLNITDAYMTGWKQRMNECFIRRVASEAEGVVERSPSGESLVSKVTEIFYFSKSAGYRKSTDIERLIWMFLKHPHELDSTECREVIGDKSCPPARRLERIESMLYGVKGNEEL